jgi:hypothetical protein
MDCFATPPIKLKLGQQIGGGQLISKPPWTNHYDRPIRNTEQQLDHIFDNHHFGYITKLPK